MRSPFQWHLKYIVGSLLFTSLIYFALSNLSNRTSFAQQGNTSASPPTPAASLAPFPATPTPPPVSIAYMQQGDLWLKTLPDGNPQRLTQNGTNYAPRWSPSGQSLSYLIDPAFPNVRVISREGGGATNYGGAVYDAYAWSPLRDWLAYGVDGSIWVSGMPLVRYEDIPAPIGYNRQISKLAWSPDGEQIAFTWRATQENSGVVDDGLWVVDLPDGRPERILDGTVPETGEIILHGWSGDGKHLLYWQAPILSASILADGVPLYALPVEGGTPQVIADAVLVHDDAVQVQPGSDQIAVVVGAGRAVWTNKRLQLLSTSGDTQDNALLSLDDQSAAAPVWSPDGQQLAYVGMPDTTDAVVGGDLAHEALLQRRIWLVDEEMAEPVQVTGLDENGEATYRDEAPRWIDDDTLLFARLDAEGRLSLWTVHTDGSGLQQVVEEITPAPEWFGFYGYIDWRGIFALWQPSMAADMDAQRMAQEALPAAFPPLGDEGRSYSLASFLERLHQDLTLEDAQAIWGEPEMSTGSQEASGERLITLQYELDDGLRIRLGFPNDDPLTYMQVQEIGGRVYALMPLDNLSTTAPTPPPLFGTATPMPTETPVQSSQQDSQQSPLATPTPE